MTLTANYVPRGMRAGGAAAYLGMSRSKFLELVAENRMPRPIPIDSMTVWDRFDLDASFEDFKKAASSVNSFDALLLGARK